MAKKETGWGAPHLRWGWIVWCLLAAIVVTGFFAVVGK